MNNEEVIKYIGEWLLRFPNCDVEKCYVDGEYNHIPELLT